MFMHDLPSALMPMVTGSAPYPGLHRRMIFFHAGKAPKPVGERQVAAYENTQVTHLCPEGVWKAGQARLPNAAELMGVFDLERRFHVEDNGLICVVAHDAIRIFCADGAHLVADELSNLGFVVRFGGLGGHRHLL